MTAATVVAVLLALGPTAGAAPAEDPGTDATSTAGRTSTAGLPAPVATPPASGCQVVAAGRAGRAWLPWARLALPGGRLVSVDVVTGVARADVHAGTVLLQRTSRRSPAAAAPVQVAVLVAGPEGTAWRACTVDLGRPDVRGDHHVRRLTT